ncbi:MAG: hypothetical protein BWY91_02640 [bacterium ADurb.BinA028]|nr:MAG: hypothetical protein BWY91_02640 [bacterium ADurb.BinA028]
MLPANDGVLALADRAHEPRPELSQSTGHEDDDEHEDDAEADELDLALGIGDEDGNEPPQPVVEQLHRDSTDEGAPHGAEAAEHDHQQDLHRQLEVRHRRIDDGQPVCVKHTGQTGIPGADDEHAKPQGERVHAEALGRDLGVVDRAECAPGAAVDEVAGQPEPDDDDGGQQEEVLLGCVVNPAAERDVGQAEDAGRATGELLLGDENPDDDAQAEGGQREEVTAQPQERQPHEQGDEHGCDDRDRRREQRVEVGLGHEQRLRIGTDGDEGGVPEAHLTGQAHEQREPDGREPIDERPDPDIDHLLRRGGSEHEQPDQQGNEGDLALEQRAHTRTAEVLPAKPLGRKSSTRTRTTKATASR